MARGEPVRRLHDGFVPGRFAVDAYGRGGFRFAEMSHQGSILALPSGIHAWEARTPADLTPEAFAKVIAERDAIDVLLVGAGELPVPMADAARWVLRDAGIGVDVMTTGAAARTYNVMVAEGRRVAAALLAVD
ncbi:Mth938-like domain-containing protein [Phreatobacter sp. AB_2022a]|uniref:Mth938-like domain-containing protein n=1 Tax=Phreatobacter sp. AB_2022a TaxID=3003134 RepID=UPI002286DD13|nr:MTH938/NDUFAF3 family protein [Phreatobacter sp. AB_2022a]MCZ0736759.1 MTH938/NDUFAF3 family protein [Phreatobacter sp. AB_2022a]